MGIFWSRAKVKKNSKEALEDLEDQIRETKRSAQRNLNSEKSFTAFLLLASCVIYLIALALFYFYFFPTSWMERVINTSPLIVFPVVVYFVKRLLGALFAQRKERIESALKDLYNEKTKILDEVKENEPYKVAMELLQKYDPRQAMMRPQPGQPAPKGPSGAELRQRHSPAVKQSGVGKPTAARHSFANPTAATGQPNSNSPNPSLLQHQNSQSSLPADSSEEGMFIPPGMSIGSAPGPPLALRNAVPQERSSFDKFLDYVVGDGPGQRYALVCSTCYTHNGMALKDEFEYITFRCAYCYHLNPARKKLPTAPKLMKIPGTDQPEKQPLVQDKNKENVDSPQLIKRSSSQGQMHIPEKVVEKVEEEQQNT